MRPPAPPDQGQDFHTLAGHINGGYTRHPHKDADANEAWKWAIETLCAIEASGSCVVYTTQELLDIPFLLVRLDRFSGGSILAAEPLLRLILTEVVRRVKSEQPPVFVQGDQSLR
jgi:hypothetical protein